MVRLLVAYVLLACGVTHAAALTARLDKSAVALGEAISLTLQSRESPLDTLDTAPLDDAFEVFARTRSQGADGDTLVLTLYPRRAGLLQVPALEMGGRRSAALPLNVSDGSETVPRVTAQWTLAPAEPRVGEPARLTLAICDDGSLQWQRPKLPAAAGRVLRELGEDEGEGTQGDTPCTQHRYHWAVLATQSAAATLAVPMLDASRFGERLRFPGAELSYRALALPAWLPAHVPPVAPRIQADPLPARWPLSRPLAWRIEVEGGYSEAGLQALLDMQVRASPALGVYPPLIEAVPLDAVDSPLSRYRVTFYLQPHATGRVAVPPLRLPWYDSGRGQIAGVAIAGATLTVFDPRWRVAGQVAGAIAGVLVLIVAGWVLRRAMRWRLAKWRGLRAIRAAADTVQLARAVRRFSLTGQPEAPSLGAWRRRMRQEIGRCVDDKLMATLEARRYGHALTDEAEVRAAWVRALSGVRPASRFRRG
jgi:hypothetical protein